MTATIAIGENNINDSLTSRDTSLISENHDPVLEVFKKNIKDLHPPKRSPPSIENNEVIEEPLRTTWLGRNIKRLVYIPLSIVGMGVGYYLGSVAQGTAQLSWRAFFLGISGSVMTLPHFIPSVLGLCMEDSSLEGPIKSTVPITYRWVTRGDENSHLTRTAIEMAHMLLSRGGHKNVRLQVVTDEFLTQDTPYGKVQVKSHILLAKERGMLPDYVDVVVVPKTFIPPKRTRKKGRALAYAALRDKVMRLSLDSLRTARTLYDELRAEKNITKENRLKLSRWKSDILSTAEELEKNNPSPRAYKLAKQAYKLLRALKGKEPSKDISYIERFLNNSLRPWGNLKVLQSKMRNSIGKFPPHLREKGQAFLEALNAVDPVEDERENSENSFAGFGEIQQLAILMIQLPGVIESIFLSEEDLVESIECSESLARWISQMEVFQETLLKHQPYHDLSSGVMHLDEESVVSKEFISGVNQFTNKKENTWKLGQGAISYADRLNRRKWKWDFESFQARWCQMLDSVRRGDDAGRFFWQFQGINKVLFGAKGSFLYIPQIVEQFENYNFDGGDATSITEDACLAFNMSSALKTLEKDLKKELHDIVDLHGDADSFLHKAHEFYSDHLLEAVSVNITSDLMAGRKLDFLEGMGNEISRLQQDLFLVLRKFGMIAYKDDLDMHIEELRQKCKGLVEEVPVLSPEAELRLHELKLQELEGFVTKFVKKVDSTVNRKFLGFSLGTKDCGWISGELLEQSPFTFWELILQRRRWFTGLETLIQEHTHISPLRRVLFRSAIWSWQAMPLSAATSLSMLITGGKALSALPSAFLGWVFVTYLFIYGWGWLRQTHDPLTWKNMSLSLMLPVQLSAVYIFESFPTLLAKFWPDLNFQLVEKHRSLDDMLETKEQLFQSSYTDLKSYEEYLALVKIMHKEYLKAFAKEDLGNTHRPVTFEEFLNLLPKIPGEIDREIENRGEDFQKAIALVLEELESARI